MTCLNYMKIRSVALTGVKSAYVPCGKCPECRDKAKFSWQFRLRAEWEGLSHRPETWHCAFFTLTYGTEKGGYPCDMRPTLPEECFVNPEDFDPENPVYCFNREHVRELLDNFKVWLHDKYSITKEFRHRVLATSEYGELRHRPHYHCLLFYPLVNGLTDSAVYNFLKDFWQKRHGMFFPQKLNGGDSNNKGKTEAPFVVDRKDGRIEKTIAYVAKYICKDLEFGKVLSRYKIRKCKLLKNYDCFHIQSKSLGACFLEGLTDYQKLLKVNKGHSFVGDEKFRPLPVYLKNKIIYDNVYIKKTLPDGEVKRLCRKEANEFFKNHYVEIYNKKVECVKKMFDGLNDIFNSAIIRNGFNVTELLRDAYEDCRTYDLDLLAKYAISWYGRPYWFWTDAPHSLAYLSKYDKSACCEVSLCNSLDVSYSRHLSDKIHTLYCIQSIVGSNKSKYDEDVERFLHELRESLQ